MIKTYNLILLSFNRYIVECKYVSDADKAALDEVLIDT